MVPLMRFFLINISGWTKAGFSQAWMTTLPLTETLRQHISERDTAGHHTRHNNNSNNNCLSSNNSCRRNSILNLWDLNRSLVSRILCSLRCTLTNRHKWCPSINSSTCHLRSKLDLVRLTRILILSTNVPIQIRVVITCTKQDTVRLIRPTCIRRWPSSTVNILQSKSRCRRQRQPTMTVAVTSSILNKASEPLRMTWATPHRDEYSTKPFLLHQTDGTVSLWQVSVANLVNIRS